MADFSGIWSALDVSVKRELIKGIVFGMFFPVDVAVITTEVASELLINWMRVAVCHGDPGEALDKIYRTANKIRSIANEEMIPDEAERRLLKEVLE